MNQKYIPGLRAIKTAFAVFLCFLLSLLLNRSDPFFASIAAIICMQQTYNQTFYIGVHRFIGTIIGGVCGYLMLEIGQFNSIFGQSWTNTILAPLCILLVIYICNVFNFKASVSIAGIVLLSILSRPDMSANNTLMYVIDRVIDTSLGIIIAMLVNRYMFPKKTKQIHEP